MLRDLTAIDSADPGGRWLHRQPDHRRIRSFRTPPHGRTRIPVAAGVYATVTVKPFKQVFPQ